MKYKEYARARLLKDLSRDPGILILAYPYARSWEEIPAFSVRDAWSRVPKGESTAIYVHIPFCRRKCKFCDFLAYYGRPEDEIKRYMTLLRDEIQQVTALASHVDVTTIHLGGGTPSLLSAKQTDSLLHTIGSNLKLMPDVQVTMEIFPDEHVTSDQLAGWRAAGVNRLSFGFQFFDDGLKRILNRTDLVYDNLRLFREARKVGYDDMNIDLMCGLPEQSSESWHETIVQTLNLCPAHVCVFPVSVRHPGIALFNKHTLLPPADRTRQMYDEAARMLIEAGYRRTTRHNFVLPGFGYKYERMIAELRPLVGLGANSISYAHDCIYKNHSDLSLYASSLSDGGLPIRSGHLFLEAENPHNYAVRRIEYLSLSGEDFKNEFGKPLGSVLSSEIELLQDFGLARMAGEDLYLTEDGIYFTSAVKRIFFHQNAWERLREMRPEEFKIERGLLPILSTKSLSIQD